MCLATLQVFAGGIGVGLKLELDGPSDVTMERAFVNGNPLGAKFIPFWLHYQ